MPDPLLALELPLVVQDTDAALVEGPFSTPSSYTLGSGLSRPYPSGALLIPKGAGPYDPPDVPTAGAAITTGNLVSNGHYKWAVTLVTDWGETVASDVLDLSAGIGSGKTGQTLNLPGWVARLDNPVRMRRLYRTIHNGSQLLLVAEIDDSAETQYVDEVSDTELTVAVPVVDTSGAIGSVDVFDGTTHWTEVAYVPSGTLSTKTFAVDYSVITGGKIYFSSSDSGIPITITYFAGTLLGSTWLNQYQSGLQEVYNYFRVETTPEFSHNLQIDGNLIVLGTSTLTGAVSTGSTLQVGTNLTVLGTSHLEGNVTLDNGLAVAGATTLASLGVTGNTTIGGTLGVTGTTTLSNLLVSGTLGVTGTTTLGNVSVGGTLGVTGTTTLGNVSIGGTLGVTGATSLGNLSVGGTLGVTGASTLAGLTATAIHATSTLQVDGNATFNGTITATGGSISLATLGVSGTTTTGVLHVTGTSALDGAVTMGSTLAIGGNITTAIHGTSTLQIDGLSTLTGVVTAHDEMSTYKTSHLRRIVFDDVNSTSPAKANGDLTLQSHAGSGATASFGATSYNSAGIVQVHTGSGSSNGPLVRVAYTGSISYSAEPIVLLTGLGTTSSDITWSISNSNGSYFEIAVFGVADATTYDIMYLVVG